MKSKKRSYVYFIVVTIAFILEKQKKIWLNFFKFYSTNVELFLLNI